MVKVLLESRVVRKIKNYLTRVVLKIFTSDAWNFSKEIVIMTGASNWMGAATARDIAGTSACVVPLDLSLLLEPHRK